MPRPVTVIGSSTEHLVFKGSAPWRRDLAHVYYSDEGLQVQSAAAVAGPAALAAVRPCFKAAAFAEFRQDWGVDAAAGTYTLASL
jgi:hypothetical protein